MRDKSKLHKPPEAPVASLPKERKRPHAYGSPSVDEFYAAIAKARRQRAAGRRKP